MKRVRVLVANQPRLMRELVLATISDQADIEIVGEVADESELTDAVEQVHPDVLILAINKYFYTILGNRTDGRIQVISSDLRLFGNWSDLTSLPAQNSGLEIPLACSSISTPTWLRICFWHRRFRPAPAWDLPPAFA